MNVRPLPKMERCGWFKPSPCRSHAAELRVNWPQCSVVQAALPTDNRTPPFPKVAAFSGQPIPQSPFHAIGHLHGTVTLPSSFHRPDRGRDFAPTRSADSPIARNDIRGGSIPTARTNVSPTAHIRARRQPTTRMECVAPIPTSPGHQSKPSERVAEGILPESTGIHACDTTYSANRDGFATIRPGYLSRSMFPSAQTPNSFARFSPHPRPHFRASPEKQGTCPRGERPTIIFIFGRYLNSNSFSAKITLARPKNSHFQSPPGWPGQLTSRCSRRATRMIVRPLLKMEKYSMVQAVSV